MRAVRGMSGWLILWLAAQASAAPTAESVMDAYLSHFGNVTYTATEQLQERQTDGGQAQVVNVLRQKPGRDYSRVFYGPVPYKGIVSADDGHRLVIYVPNEARLYEYASYADQARVRRRGELQRLRERFTLRLVGTESVANRSCHHLRLTPREGSGPTIDVWIDAGRFVALRQEIRQGDRLWRASRFKRIQYDAALSDSDFQFTPPDGTQRITVQPRETAPGYDYTSPAELRRKAGLRIMVPGYVPAGFRLQAYQVGAPRPGALFNRRLSVRYLKGKDLILISQGVSGPLGSRHGERPADVPTELKPGVFYWTRYGLRLLLIGPRDHDADDLRRCAASVDWYDAPGRGTRQTGLTTPGRAEPPVTPTRTAPGPCRHAASDHRHRLDDPTAPDPRGVWCRQPTEPDPGWVTGAPGLARPDLCTTPTDTSPGRLMALPPPLLARW